jgi:hypothetical protein
MGPSAAIASHNAAVDIPPLEREDQSSQTVGNWMTVQVDTRRISRWYSRRGSRVFSLPPERSGARKRTHAASDDKTGSGELRQLTQPDP